MNTLSIICDVIVLIGGVSAAVLSILKLMGKPVRFAQKKYDKLRKKELDGVANAVSQMVLKELTPELDEIKYQINNQQTTSNILVRTTKDLLRKSIMEIYDANKAARRLTETEREMLDDLYKDYTAEHGNSYIEKIYNRMIKWDITPDEE